MKLRIRQAIYILLAIVALALLIIVVTNSQSPESLMVPPDAVGDYKDIQDVITNTNEQGIILKAPNEGEFTTAITFADLNDDKENDAIAFYRMKNDDTSSIYMSVLIQQSGKWFASQPLKGKGNDILEFAYGDLNYDAIPEVVVGWNMFDSKDNNSLCVYSVDYADKKTTLKEIDSLIYTKMFVEDICSEGKEEILLVKNTYNDDTADAKAVVYELEDNQLKALSSADMLAQVSEYKKIQTQKINKKNVFFLDGVFENNQMVTEILYWDTDKGTLVNDSLDIFSEHSTLRKGTVPALDINNDGVIEIPFNDIYSEQSVAITEWKQFSFDGFRSVCRGVCSDELIFVFPEKWNNSISVTQKGNIWSFFDVSGAQREELFELVSCDISSWQPLSDKYDKLKIDYGTIYGVKINASNSKLTLNKNEIKQAIIDIR